MTYYVLKFKELPYEGASPYATLMVASPSNDSDIEYHISASDLNPLLAFNDSIDALKVSKSTTDYYNSEPNSPINDYIGELEVVPFNLP